MRCVWDVRNRPFACFARERPILSRIESESSQTALPVAVAFLSSSHELLLGAAVLFVRVAEFSHASLVDEDGHGDAEHREDPQVFRGEPESLLQHLSRRAVRLDELVRDHVRGGSGTTSHCGRKVEGRSEGRRSAGDREDGRGVRVGRDSPWPRAFETDRGVVSSRGRALLAGLC